MARAEGRAGRACLLARGAGVARGPDVALAPSCGCGGKLVGRPSGGTQGLEARARRVGPPGACRAAPWEAVGLPVAVTLLVACPRYPGGRAGELVAVRGEAPIGAARWREGSTAARAPGARRGRPAAPALAGVRGARRAVEGESSVAALSASLRWTLAPGAGGRPVTGPAFRGPAVLGAAARSPRLLRGAGARPAARTGSVALAAPVEPACITASTLWTLCSRAIVLPLWFPTPGRPSVPRDRGWGELS